MTSPKIMRGIEMPSASQSAFFQLGLQAVGAWSRSLLPVIFTAEGSSSSVFIAAAV